jgi:hypothetical protein
MIPAPAAAAKSSSAAASQKSEKSNVNSLEPVVSKPPTVVKLWPPQRISFAALVA